MRSCCTIVNFDSYTLTQLWSLYHNYGTFRVQINFQTLQSDNFFQTPCIILDKRMHVISAKSFKYTCLASKTVRHRQTEGKIEEPISNKLTNIYKKSFCKTETGELRRWGGGHSDCEKSHAACVRGRMDGPRM